MVVEAAAEFPASWIRAANRVPLTPWHMEPRDDLGGYYARAEPHRHRKSVPGRGDVDVPAGEAMLVAVRSKAASLHEYAHHLQETVPGLDRQFRAMHRRRTTRPDGTRDPVVELPKYGGRDGRTGMPMSTPDANTRRATPRPGLTDRWR